MKKCHPFTVLCALALCLTAALFTGGCSLALEEPPLTGNDRLAGIFVTEESIEPEAPLLEVNGEGEIHVSDTGPRKIYGTFTGYDKDAPIVTFPGLQGYGIYSLQVPEDKTHEASGYTACDSIFTDCHFAVTDEEESFEASFYAVAGTPAHYYFNYVYQQPDGKLYLVPGTGVSSDSFLDGQKYSQSIAQSSTRTVNGAQTTQGQHFIINVIGADPPLDMELFLMDAQHQVLQRYPVQELDRLAAAGDSLTLPPGSAYLVLQQTLQATGQSRRSLFDQGAEYLDYMVPEADSYLHVRQLPLLWP